MCRIVAVYSELRPFQADALERAPADSPTAGRTDSERCTLGHIDRFTPALGRRAIASAAAQFVGSFAPCSSALFTLFSARFFGGKGVPQIQMPLAGSSAHRLRPRRNIEPAPRGRAGFRGDPLSALDALRLSRAAPRCS